MNWTYVLLASITEGLTEFIPVSSTGHLIILNHALGIIDSSTISSFNLFIQLGAILAVVHLYYKDLIQSPKIITNLILSFLPTALVGLIFYPLIKNNFLNNLPLTIFSLFLGGVIIILLGKNLKETSKEEITATEALKIGLFQSLSIIPGTSRALASIVGGLASGLSLKQSIKYSFLLAIPTIAAATFFDLLQNKDALLAQTESAPFFLVGFFLSYLVAKLSLKYFLKVINNLENFSYFGYYRIFIAFLILVVKYLPL